MQNELKVEHYDASEVESKKKKILKMVATGVGAAALVTMLASYGLAQEGTEPVDSTGQSIAAKVSDTTLMTDQKILDSLQRAEKKARLDSLQRVRRMREFMMGGNGAWFNSVVEFLG